MTLGDFIIVFPAHLTPHSVQRSTQCPSSSRKSRSRTPSVFTEQGCPSNNDREDLHWNINLPDTFSHEPRASKNSGLLVLVGSYCSRRCLLGRDFVSNYSDRGRRRWVADN